MKHGTLLVVDDNRNILSTVKMVMEHTFEHIVCMKPFGTAHADKGR